MIEIIHKSSYNNWLIELNLIISQQDNVRTILKDKKWLKNLFSSSATVREAKT